MIFSLLLNDADKSLRRLQRSRRRVMIQNSISSIGLFLLFFLLCL